MQDLKRRLDLAATQLAQHTGQFEFISSQLRDVQRCMHVKLGDVDQRSEQVDKHFEQVERKQAEHDVRFDRLEAKADALPRVIAEMLAKKG